MYTRAGRQWLSFVAQRPVAVVGAGVPLTDFSRLKAPRSLKELLPNFIERCDSECGAETIVYAVTVTMFPLLEWRTCSFHFWGCFLQRSLMCQPCSGGALLEIAALPKGTLSLLGSSHSITNQHGSMKPKFLTWGRDNSTGTVKLQITLWDSLRPLMKPQNCPLTPLPNPASSSSSPWVWEHPWINLLYGNLYLRIYFC